MRDRKAMRSFTFEPGVGSAHQKGAVARGEREGRWLEEGGGVSGEVVGGEGAVGGAGWGNLRLGYCVGCAWRIGGANVEGREVVAGEWCGEAE